MALGVLISLTPAGVLAEDGGQVVSENAVSVMAAKGLVTSFGTPITKPGFYSIEDRDYNEQVYYVDYVNGQLAISKGNHTAYKRENDTVVWLTVNGKWYLLDADDGHVLTGWQMVDGNLYYLDIGDFAMTNGDQSKGGWRYLNDSWYAFYSWGGVRRGWYTYRGKTYYLQNDGRMQLDPLELNGKKYYFDKDGVLYKNRVYTIYHDRLNTESYLLQEDGSVCCTPGWNLFQGSWYWVGDESGKLLKGEWLTYEGNQYFLKWEGKMASSEWLYQKYYFKSWGGCYQNEWAKIDGKWYYFGEDGQKYAGRWLEYKGNLYYFDEEGRMYGDR